MFTKVVLPAPLAPIMPTTESRSIEALTSFAAVTAPNALFSPRASMIAAISGALPALEHRPEPLWKEHDDEQQGRAHRHLPGVGREIVRGAVDRLVDQRAEEGGGPA